MVRFMRLNPAVRQAVAVALVIERNDLLVQHSIQVLTVARVVQIRVGIGAACADGKAIQAIVGLRPPAVQNREIQAAVQNHFLATGSGCFKRAPGLFSHTSTPCTRWRPTLIS